MWEQIKTDTVHRIVEDHECRTLVAMLNCIPGLTTLSCCSGHGRDPLSVFFRVDRHTAIDWLVQCIGENSTKWVVEVGVGCIEQGGIRGKGTFYALTTTAVGDDAYADAERLGLGIVSLVLPEGPLGKECDDEAFGDSDLRSEVARLKARVAELESFESVVRGDDFGNVVAHAVYDCGPMRPFGCIPHRIAVTTAVKRVLRGERPGPFGAGWRDKNGNRLG